VKSAPEILAQMERDLAVVNRLRSRWNHLFAASCVLNGAGIFVIFTGRPYPAAMILTVCSLALLHYARRFPRRAMEILRKYEDMTMP